MDGGYGAVRLLVLFQKTFKLWHCGCHIFIKSHMAMFAVWVVVAAERTLLHHLKEGEDVVAFEGVQVALKVLNDGLRRVYADNLPILYQGDTVAAGGLIHVRGGYHHRDVVLADRFQDVPELLSRHGIHASGGLVEEEDAGPVDQGAAEGQLLLHAAGELARLTVFERRNLLPDGLDDVHVLLNAALVHHREE